MRTHASTLALQLPDEPDEFKQAARELGCDDDPDHFRERLGKLVKHKPVEKPADWCGDSEIRLIMGPLRSEFPNLQPHEQTL